MTLTQIPGALKKFRRAPWRFQQTFQTQLQNLRPFVSAIVRAKEPLQGGSVTLGQVVFEPKNWMSLLARHSLPPEYGRDWTVTAGDTGEVEELLEAALSDWLDFLFIPTPKPFVVYADHDQFTTFYASTKSNLNGVVEALSGKGFKWCPGSSGSFEPRRADLSRCAAKHRFSGHGIYPPQLLQHKIAIALRHGHRLFSLPSFWIRTVPNA